MQDCWTAMSSRFLKKERSRRWDRQCVINASQSFCFKAFFNWVIHSAFCSLFNSASGAGPLGTDIGAITRSLRLVDCNSVLAQARTCARMRGSLCASFKMKRPPQILGRGIHLRIQFMKLILWQHTRLLFGASMRIEISADGK